MTLHRREVLAALGAASASSLLWALGCGGPAPLVRRAPQVSGEVRTWLRDAVARLAASYPAVHALAVSRRRTTAARDVLGAGVARLRAEGVVLTVRDPDGRCREHATSELSRDAVDAAARALGAGPTPRGLEFGPAPTAPAEPPLLDDGELHDRVSRLLEGDAALSRRLVYAAAAVDVDDATVWSVAPGRDLEQRLVRIRNTAVRAASGGGRPVVRTAERAWSGWLDDHPLTPGDLVATSESALEVLTPGGFDDGERPVVLDPSVVAVVLDAAVRGLLTPAAARRPEVARRLADAAASAAPLASPLVTLVDDPTAPGAYGGFAFDDEGEPAAPVTLLDAGRIAAQLSDRSAAQLTRGPATSPADRSSSAGNRGNATSAGGDGAGTGGMAGGRDVSSATSTGGDSAPGSRGGGRELGSAGSGGGGGSAAGSRGRRPGHLAPLVVAPSHLVLVPGTADLRALHSDGFILEGGISAQLAADGDRVRVACTRARELRGGKTTGRLYADVELVGSLRALLTAIDAVAAEPTSFAPTDAGGDPLWRSISAPAVRTRGFVRGPRSRA